MKASASGKVISGGPAAPSASSRAHGASLRRSWVAAARARTTVDATTLKASPEGEGFNPPSGGQ